MNCRSFHEWLDGSMPGDRAAADAHAASCPRCAAAWRAAVQIEELLAADDPPLPAGFTDRVMRSLPSRAAVSRPGAAPGAGRGRRTPTHWAETAAVAIMVAGIAPVFVSWAGPAGRAISRSLAQVVGASAGWPAPLLDPSMRIAIGLMLLPAVLFASRSLFYWTAERVGGGALGPSRAAKRG